MLKIPRKLVFRLEVTLLETEFDSPTTEGTTDNAAKDAHSGFEESGAGASAVPTAASQSQYRGPQYVINAEVQPPQRGSINWEVWERALKLPSPFTSDQFESVVGPAMQYDHASGEFRIPTNRRSLREAEKAYLSEFRKRRFIIEAN